MLQKAVVVIGGGATGVGVLRDLALRGVPALLIEAGDLAQGTSSRFHGLLHSGARYAVRDPESARDCIVENGVLRRVAARCVEETEGLFVRLPEDDPAYEGRWIEACKTAGIPVEPVPLGAVQRLEPHLTTAAVAVYRIPDAAIDGFRLVWQNAAAAQRAGAEVLTYARVTAIDVHGGRIEGVRYRSALDGREERLSAACVVNATGPWVAEVARLGGVQVAVRPDRGTLVAFNHRFTSRVVNRLRPPADGDIFVPHGSVTILGTTSAPAERPDDHGPRPEEVRRLLQHGRRLFEDLSAHRILRAFSGTRPLYDGGTGGRAASRSFVLIDHATEGLAGFYSITGGKLTTYRRMAEVVADHVCAQLGAGGPCRTAVEPLVEEPPRRLRRRARRVLPPHVVESTFSRLGPQAEPVFRRLQAAPEARQLVCECELVTRAEVEEAGARPTTHSLDDVRRRTRLGMGTCQGTFCALRGIATLAAARASAGPPPVVALREFLQARWRGIRPALWGKQLRETELLRAIYQATLNVDGGRP